MAASSCSRTSATLSLIHIWRANQQNALGDTRAQSNIFFTVAQERDHLLQLFLFLPRAGHIGKCNLPPVGHTLVRIGFPKLRCV